MIRLQKYLADLGYGSRRKIEEYILNGQVLINDQVATIGIKVSGTEQIKLKGQVVANLARKVVIDLNPRILLYHKPTGEISSASDPQDRPTVFDRLPKLQHKRWIQVGRLDFNTSGVLLFTTSGELANKLMHPKFNIKREYLVRVKGQLDSQQINNLLNGVYLDDGSSAKFINIIPVRTQKSNCWYKVALNRGKYREVRRLFTTQGIEVNRLIRTSFGSITLPRDLKPGDYTELDYLSICKAFNI